MNIFGILFARKDANIDKRAINHETIHTKQIIECGFIFFYIWYIIEYFIKKIVSLFVDNGYYRNYAYRSISFEQEAYYNDKNKNYTSERKHYGWLKYIFKMYDLKFRY